MNHPICRKPYFHCGGAKEGLFCQRNSTHMGRGVLTCSVIFWFSWLSHLELFAPASTFLKQSLLFLGHSILDYKSSGIWWLVDRPEWRMYRAICKGLFYAYKNWSRSPGDPLSNNSEGHWGAGEFNISGHQEPQDKILSSWPRGSTGGRTSDPEVMLSWFICLVKIQTRNESNSIREQGG